MRPGAATVTAGVVLAGRSCAGAEAAWPTPTPEWLMRGPGGGIGLVGPACWWLVVLAWMRTADWVSRDAAKRVKAPAFWTTVCGLPLPAAAILAWWIPSASAAIALMLAAWLVPVGIYASVRNRGLPASQRVFTTGHARRVVAGWLARVGIQIAEEIDEAETLPTVEPLAAGGRDDAENQARRAAAAALPGFEEARRMLQAAVVARAGTLVIETGTETTLRHEVDGVWGKPRLRQPPRSRREKESWVEVPPSSRDVGLAVSAAFRALCGLPVTAASAAGRFAVSVDGKPRACRLSAKVAGGVEHLAVQIEAPAAVFRKLPDLGMSEPTTRRLAQLLAVEKGVVLVSAAAGQGLTTTFDLVVESADRLLRDFISLEDAALPAREIQNVKPVRYDARTGVAPLAALADALREYPAAIVARDVRDPELVAELVRLAADDKLVIIGLKAVDAADAAARLVACGIPPQTVAATVVGSLSQRLVRRLCPKCRVEIPTPEPLLAKLGKTAEALPHVRKAAAEGCRLCGGCGYLGRTAIFELASGSTFRRAIAAAVPVEKLRQAAVADGMLPLRDAGLALVITGTTSLEELQRVLKPPSAADCPPLAPVSTKAPAATPAPAEAEAAPPTPGPATGSRPASVRPPPGGGGRIKPPPGRSKEP